MCSVFSSVNSAFSAVAVLSWYSVFSLACSVFSATAVLFGYSVLSAAAERRFPVLGIFCLRHGASPSIGLFGGFFFF